MMETQGLKRLQRGWEMPGVRIPVDRYMAGLRTLLLAGWQRVRLAQQAIRTRSERRCLRVTESVSLGDKRSVYLIEVDGQRMLLGASAAGVTLLSHLESDKGRQLRSVKDLLFADVMENCTTAKAPKKRSQGAASVKEAT